MPIAALSNELLDEITKAFAGEARLPKHATIAELATLTGKTEGQIRERFEQAFQEAGHDDPFGPIQI